MRSKRKHQISTRFWRRADRPALEFAKISYEDFHFEPHFHDHYVILLVEEGVNLGQRHHEKYEVKPGEMLVIQPGEMHTGSSFESKMLRYIAFYPPPSSVTYWLESAERGSTGDPGFNLKYNNPALRSAFRKLVSTATNEMGEPLEVDSVLLDFFDTLSVATSNRCQSPQKTVPDSKKLKRAQDFIRDHFTDSISLDDLANVAEASPYYLIRLFRQRTGLTPFDYLRSFRVEQAKRLMQTNLSLTEVAYEAGFYDQSHFIHSFKKQTGFLPSDFQNQ